VRPPAAARLECDRLTHVERQSGQRGDERSPVLITIDADEQPDFLRHKISPAAGGVDGLSGAFAVVLTSKRHRRDARDIRDLQ
jgi:hypothetical protein